MVSPLDALLNQSSTSPTAPSSHGDEQDPSAPSSSDEQDPFASESDVEYGGVEQQQQQRQQSSGKDEEEEEEEEARDLPADSAQDSTREITARAIGLASHYPPVLRVRCGKAKALSFELQLCGDLVWDISSPAFLFKLRVHARDPSNVDSPHVVDEILGVVEGPCIAAKKLAANMQAARGGAGAPFVVPAPTTTIGVIKSCLTKSEYISNVAARAAMANRTATTIGSEIVAPKMWRANTVVHAHVLDKHVSYDGPGVHAWAMRNLLRTEEFFMRANYVGGSGVDALHRIDDIGGSDGTTWKIITGAPGGLIDEPEVDGPEVLRILEVVHFARREMSPARALALRASLRVSMSDEVRARADLIEMAARVYHRMSARGTSGADNDIHWAAPGEQWPQPMRDLLRKHGVYTQQKGGGRWYACREEVRAYFATVSESIGSNVHYVRAETDDDHENVDGGYVAFLTTLVRGHSPNIVLLSSNVMRKHYLMQYAGFQEAECINSFPDAPAAEETVVVIDRAHQIKKDTLFAAIRRFSRTAPVKKIYVCGATLPSVSANGGGGSATIFAQLYARADVGKSTTVSATLSEDKVARGKNPVDTPAAVRGPLLIFVLSGLHKSCTADRTSNIIPPDLKAAFPSAMVTTPSLHATTTGWKPTSSSIVVITPDWTREDLAVVWQCTVGTVDAIWFAGPHASTWTNTIRQRKRQRPTASAVLL